MRDNPSISDAVLSRDYFIEFNTTGETDWVSINCAVVIREAEFL